MAVVAVGNGEEGVLVAVQGDEGSGRGKTTKAVDRCLLIHREKLESDLARD